jgi:hypothetical protein
MVGIPNCHAKNRDSVDFPTPSLPSTAIVYFFLSPRRDRTELTRFLCCSVITILQQLTPGTAAKHAAPSPAAEGCELVPFVMCFIGETLGIFCFHLVLINKICNWIMI